jgi:hypothetical protein
VEFVVLDCFRGIIQEESVVVANLLAYQFAIKIIADLARFEIRRYIQYL